MAIAEYVRTYNAERRRYKESGDREKHLQRRNGELEIDRLITNIAKGADFDTTTQRSMSSRPNGSASRPSSHRSPPLPRSSPSTRRRSSAISPTSGA